MNIESIQYQADHPDMQPAVRVGREGRLWYVTWGEPARASLPLWRAYRQHCDTILLPRLRDAWPTWAASVDRRSRMTLMAGRFGCLSRAPDAVVLDAVGIVLSVFPHAVVLWPRTRPQRGDRTRVEAP